MRPIVLKLGGSAITDKTKTCTPNVDVIQHSISQIAEYEGPLVLLHGGGSFAHPFVQRVALHKGYRGPFQLVAVSETELYLDQLTRIVGAALLSKKIPFVPIRPMNFITLRKDRTMNCFLDPMKLALDLGLVPLMHGDLAFDNSGGVGVLSADHLASFLGVKLGASRVLFGCDVGGVYSQDPRVSSNARLVEVVTKENHRSVLEMVAKHPSTDATGGMFSKVAEAVRAARLGVESIIFDVTKGDLLGNVLKHRRIVGTRFVPWG